MLTIVVGFIIIYLKTKLNWALYVSTIMGLVGIFSDFLSKKIDYLWLKLTLLLSLVVPNILLSLIYFIFLTPIAVLSRLLDKKNGLQLKNKAGSMFMESNKQFNKSSFEKPW